MSMVFPGMDPYLEDPLVWHEFHQRMIVYLADYLQPLILPRFVASVEGRVMVEGAGGRFIYPDVSLREESRTGPAAARGAAATMAPVIIDEPAAEVTESYLEILDLSAGQKVVTVIELVSPSNKYAGEPRELYVAKQREVLGSYCNLVEIDLLRAGPHVVAVREIDAQGHGPYDYLISVNRATNRSRFEVYPLRLRNRLPTFNVPLSEDAADVALDLQQVVTTTYDRGVYSLKVRYNRPCRPPLRPEDQAWADELIRAAGAAQSNPQTSS